MKKILRIKPLWFFLTFLGMILLLFFIVWCLGQILGSAGAKIYLVLIFGGFIGYYLFWIFTISYGLELLNVKAGIPSSLSYTKVVGVVLLIFSLVYGYLFISESHTLNVVFLMALNILLGIVICFLFYDISEDYAFHAKNRPPGIFDYLMVLFQMSFFPIGLLILHAHVRLLLKSKKVI